MTMQYRKRPSVLLPFLRHFHVRNKRKHIQPNEKSIALDMGCMISVYLHVFDLRMMMMIADYRLKVRRFIVTITPHR